MSEQFEVVERVTRRVSSNPLYTALAETATTGRAVRIQANGENYNTLRSRLLSAARSRGFKFHWRKDGDAFIAWCVKESAD